MDFAAVSGVPSPCVKLLINGIVTRLMNEMCRNQRNYKSTNKRANYLFVTFPCLLLHRISPAKIFKITSVTKSSQCQLVHPCRIVAPDPHTCRNMGPSLHIRGCFSTSVLMFFGVAGLQLRISFLLTAASLRKNNARRQFIFLLVLLCAHIIGVRTRIFYRHGLWRCDIAGLFG